MRLRAIFPLLSAPAGKATFDADYACGFRIPTLVRLFVRCTLYSGQATRRFRLPSVDPTAALNGNSFLRSVDATACTYELTKLQLVLYTAALQRSAFLHSVGAIGASNR